jgi:hypothetical protein
MICGKMEHPYILEILKRYETKKLITVSYIDVNIFGEIDKSNIESKITHNTCLIIVSYINYLTGIVNNIKQISEIAHNNKIPLFCDTVYAFGKLKVYANLYSIDVLTADYGSKNICILAIKKLLFNGYKLYDQCINFQSNHKVIKLTDITYGKTITTIKRSKKLITQSRIKSIQNMRKYIINLMYKYAEEYDNKVYYYDELITSKDIPKTGDFIIFGYHDKKDTNQTNARILPQIISFICINKNNTKDMTTLLNKKNIIIYKHTDAEIKLFENMGIIEKYAKKIITLNLENCTKSIINTIFEYT